MNDEDLRVALAAFDLAALADLGDEVRIVFIDPRDFLRLAPPVSSRIDSHGRSREISAVLDGGGSLDTLPILEILVDGPDGYVQSHDGRHRAMVLLNRAVCRMPVVLEGRSYEDDEPADGEALTSLARLHPQEHDEEEDYPDASPEELEERRAPLSMRRLGCEFFNPAQLRETLGITDTSANPRTPPRF